MKEKIKAILYADTDVDIKIDFINELFDKYVFEYDDQLMMQVCNDFLIFSAHRNEYLIDMLGLPGFLKECEQTPQRKIWEAFKNYLIEQKQINEN